MNRSSLTWFWARNSGNCWHNLLRLRSIGFILPMVGRLRNYRTLTQLLVRFCLDSFPYSVNDLNNVNVRSIASTLGLTIEEKRSTEPVTFNEWLHVQAFNDGQKVISAGGTFFGSPDNPRIVRLFSQPTEIVPSGVVLLLGK